MVVYRRDVEATKAALEFDRRLARELPPVSHPARRKDMQSYTDSLEVLITRHVDPWLVKLFSRGGRIPPDLLRMQPLPPSQRPLKGLPLGVRPLIQALVVRLAENNGGKARRGEISELIQQVEHLLEEVKLRTPLGVALRSDW